MKGITGLIFVWNLILAISKPDPSITHRRLQPFALDSSANQYTLWTQISECLSYGPFIDTIIEVNRGYLMSGNLNTNYAPGNLSIWISEVLPLQNAARYPCAYAGYTGLYISFPCLVGGTWGGIGIIRLEGGEIYLDGNGFHKAILKQLPDSNLILIGYNADNEIFYATITYDLSYRIVSGIIDTGYYWGYDINGGIAYIFYFDANLNLYYKTTVDGIRWSPPQTWIIPWPDTMGYIMWTQMAVTDAGNPLLVFDYLDRNDFSYPYYGRIYVSYTSGIPPVMVSLPDTEAFYPTIASGSDYAAVIWLTPRNNLNDSLCWNDIFINWSTDQGITWNQPQNLTSGYNLNPGLPQLAKRIDALRNRAYYIFADNMLGNADLYWSTMFGYVWPIRIYFDYAPYTGIKEDARCKIQSLGLEVYPNPFRNFINLKLQTNPKAQTSIKIYDASGRLVKNFSLATCYPLLPTAVEWNGTDNLGCKLPAGVYFVQLKGRESLLIEKIIRLQ